jgi:hypothetical protein
VSTALNLYRGPAVGEALGVGEAVGSNRSAGRGGAAGEQQAHAVGLAGPLGARHHQAVALQVLVCKQRLETRFSRHRSKVSRVETRRILSYSLNLLNSCLFRV